jgi:hypothetical protein
MTELRDRFFTPRVARAMLSPSGILAAGGGVALGVVAGLPVVGAVALGVAGWAGRVALAMAGGAGGAWTAARRERIDPFTLQEPWRRFVQDALSARARFREAVDRTQPGPLQETLRSIASRVDTGVDECWLVAKRGESLVQSRRRIDVAEIERDLAEIETAQAASPEDTRLAGTLEAIRAQQATAQRMDRVIAEAHSQLRLLDARMGEAVVRALELSAQASVDASASSLSSDVDSLVTDMEALRQALEETHGSPGGLNQASGPG